MTDDPRHAVELLEMLVDAPPDRRGRLVGAASVAWSDLADGLRDLAMTNADVAIRAAELLVETAGEDVGAASVVPVMRAHARALSYVGRFDEALAVCRDAIGRAEEAHEDVELGRAHLASMHALGELGRLDEALRAGERARSAFLAIDAPHLAARADINLGGVHQRRDEPGEALRCLDQARPHLHDETVIIGHLENNRGEALFALNRFREAEAAYTAALEAFEDSGADLTTGIAQSNLAELAARQGRLAQAMRWFESARRKLESARTPAHVARLITEAAEAKAALGLQEEALADYRDGLEQLETCGLALEAARARAGMGWVLCRLGRVIDAETAFAAAAAAFDELGNATARARVDIARADIALERGDFETARRRAHGALASLLGRPADAIGARHLLARVAAAEGQLDLAGAEIEAALAMARPLDIGPLVADLLVTKSRVARTDGRLDDCIASLESAVERFERLRGALQADRHRAALMQDRVAAYDELVTAYLDRGRDGDLGRAFHVAERARSRNLLSRLSGVVAEGPREAGDDALAIEFANVQADLNALYSRLADEAILTGGPGRLESWRRAVKEREDALDRLESRSANAEGVASLFAPPIDLDATMAMLRHDETLLEYHTAGGELIAFVVTREAAVVVPGLGRDDELRARLRRLRFIMERLSRPGAAGNLDGDLEHELADLYDMVVRPFAARLGEGGRLTIVPHGLLHLVPFAALHDGERHLIECCEVVMAPSASVLDRLRRRNSSASGRPVVVDVSDRGAPWIDHEAERVAHRLDAARLTGADVTVEAALDAMSQARIVHLACHGRFLRDAPLASGLRLGDRWLTVRDVYRSRIGADLVVLSGCETAVPHVATGDELSSLLHGFLSAGAGAVVASLWRIHDERTATFMDALHARLGAGDGTEGVADALRRTQCELLAGGESPAIWSAFVLVGDR